MIIDLYPDNAEQDPYDLLGMSRDDVEAIKEIESLGDSLKKKYRKDTSSPKKLLGFDFDPYVKTINDMITKISRSNSPEVSVLGNLILNDMQCNFTMANHVEKFSFVLSKGHSEIGKYMNSLPATEKNTYLNTLLDINNFEREQRLSSLTLK